VCLDDRCCSLGDAARVWAACLAAHGDGLRCRFFAGSRWGSLQCQNLLARAAISLHLLLCWSELIVLVKHVQADNHLLFAARGEAEDRESDEEELSLPELVPESLLELELELGSGLRFLQQTLSTVADVQKERDLQHVLLLDQMLSHA